MAPDSGFRVVRLLKSDALGTIEQGVLEDPARGLVLAVRRSPGASRVWARPIAWILARREASALRSIAGIAGVPSLLATGRAGLVRSFIEGRTLPEAAPRDPCFFANARRLLRAIHLRGVTHNDTHKEANWLVTPAGAPALVDYQLASRHRRRGGWFRLCRAEDVRHLLKHKRTYCPDALTARERALLATKSWPARGWELLVKPAYLFVTRTVFRWRDAEGSRSPDRRL